MNQQSLKKPFGFQLIEGDAAEVLQSFPACSYELVVTSPPYNIGKEYELQEFVSLEKYLEKMDFIVELLVQKLSDNGSICWQVGNFVKDGELTPLDILTYQMFRKRGMKLRNRIIWRFNFGLHATRRFSGRYETILWFTKSNNYTFNLDPVRIPQLYPGKRHAASKGKKAGKPSGNPLGKNPSDFWEFDASGQFLSNSIWEIPNVKSNHPEKTFHPCQFPVELAERCVLAMTNPGDRVFDPFVGTGTTVLAALRHCRNGIGVDKKRRYLNLARKRIDELHKGILKVREIGKPIPVPERMGKVAQVPQEWRIHSSDGSEIWPKQPQKRSADGRSQESSRPIKGRKLSNARKKGK